MERLSPGEGRHHPATFVVQYCRVEIRPSARRHGIADDNILHAIEHPMVVDDLGDDPDRWLVIGPDRAGNFSKSSCSSPPKATS